MRMIGIIIPSDSHQQVDLYESGSEMWVGLCEIYDKRQNATIRKSSILCLSEELKSKKCSADADMQAHVVNMKTMLLNSLPSQSEFNQLRSAVKYGGNGWSMTPEELRVLIEEAAERQSRRQVAASGGHSRHDRGGDRSGGNSSGGNCDGTERVEQLLTLSGAFSMVFQTILNSTVRKWPRNQRTRMTVKTETVKITPAVILLTTPRLRRSQESWPVGL
ncbi:Multidrug resistance protein ABC transporter [Phytophthora megakarya]|uniref:Multidrug resistance protein ABC transporter n=1 Tax=Phytophthora megakarya TaxID=4795 RepID=A0A225WEI8_9STRA|nr:Multidrug resistance protein ABC transporter [Phytophthora megakarya]